jgi:hypothetical protein
MEAEQLVTLGPGGAVHALGDRASARVRYPGAADQRQAGWGRYLRGRADGLVLAALANLARAKGAHILALSARGLRGREHDQGTAA